MVLTPVRQPSQERQGRLEAEATLKKLLQSLQDRGIDPDELG